MARTVKVAVIGSGLAGLTAAYLLSQTLSDSVEFEVHLFEKAGSIGMDSSSVTIDTPGRPEGWRVDVPMRSFQGGYYPQLIQMYKSLGVDFCQADFSYSISLLLHASKGSRRSITTTTIYNGASGREGVSMPSEMNEAYLQTKGEALFIRLTAKFMTLLIFTFVTLQIVFNYLRLVLFSIPFMRSVRLQNKTFREWTSSTVPRGILARWTGMDRSWQDFTQQVLVPLFSAVCTAPERDVMDHPMEELLDYIWLTFGTHHYVALNGVKDVVSRLAVNVQHVRTSSPISAIHLDTDSPSLTSIYCETVSGSTEVYTGFHHIIFGTQANQAAPLLRTYSASLPVKSQKRKEVDKQIRCLEAFQYRPAIVINHTDETMMPDNPYDWRDLNLVYLNPEGGSANELQDADGTSCVSSSYTMATHVLKPPPLYPSHLPPVYQTTNPIISPRPETILSIARLERAVLTSKAKKALVSDLYTEKSKKWWQCPVQAEGGLGPLQGAGKLLVEGSDTTMGTGIWFCGSYAYLGIPLLEGCVVSARNVVEQGVLRSEGVKVTSAPW